jgi:tetratricopeptide (TPR) repeat protein
MNSSKIQQLVGKLNSFLLPLAFILHTHIASSQQISAQLQPCLDLLNSNNYVDAYPLCMEIQLRIMDDKKMPPVAIMNGLMEVSNRYLQGGYDLDAMAFNELSVEYGRKNLNHTELYYQHLLNLFGLSISNRKLDILLPAGTELAALSEELYGHSDELLPFIYLQVGNAHLLRGEYAESSDNFRKGGAVRAIQAGGQDSLCGAFIIREAEVQHLLGNYNLSINLLDDALSIYNRLKLKDPMYLADCRNLRMLTYSQWGKYDQMFEEINLLLPLLEEIELKNKLNHFTNMMIVLTDYDATFGTRITVEVGLDTIAYDMLEIAKNEDIDPQILSNAYLNLGNSFLLQKDFERVYTYYREATKILETTTGKDGNYITLNNTIAIAAEKMGNVAEAAAIYAENRQLLEKLLLNNYGFLPEEAQLTLIQSFEFTYDCILSFGIRHGSEYPASLLDAASINLLFQGIVLRNTSGLRNKMLQSGNPADQKSD